MLGMNVVCMYGSEIVLFDFACCMMIIYGLFVIYHMGLKTVDTMWCVTLASVLPYIAYRDFSFATPLIRGRVVSPTILNSPKKGYCKAALTTIKKDTANYKKSKSLLAACD